MTTLLAATFWDQNRLVVAVVLTVGIIGATAVSYLLAKRLPQLEASLSSAGNRLVVAMQLYRWLLGGTAVVVLGLSVFPRVAEGMGILLYFFLWPLLALQFGLAWIPWQRQAQKDPLTIIALAGLTAFFAFCIDRMLLQLAGYIR